MVRLLCVFACVGLVGVASADSKVRKTRHTSETSHFTIEFPTKPNKVEDEKVIATSAGNLSLVTTKGEFDGAVFSVTVTTYPDSFWAVRESEILNGVVKGLAGTDGKVVADDAITSGDAVGRAVAVQAGKNRVRANVILDGRRLYLVMISGKESVTSGKLADDFLESFKISN